MSLDQRLGRLREPRYLLLYLVGAALSAVAAGALYRVTNGARPELSGAMLVGGTAFSAQLAKDQFRRDPRRAWVLIAIGILAGAAFGALFM
jgi:membrane associated rhomboid family serine protease